MAKINDQLVGLSIQIGQKNTNVFWHQSEVRTAATVWNWSGKTLSPGALLAVLYFSSCHIFQPVQTFPRPHYLPLGLRGWAGACIGKSREVVFSKGRETRFQDYLKKKLNFFIFFAKSWKKRCRNWYLVGCIGWPSLDFFRKRKTPGDCKNQSTQGFSTLKTLRRSIIRLLFFFLKNCISKLIMFIKITGNKLWEVPF